MSRRSYTRHVPDVRMITHYAETGASRVHLMNPWTKAVLLLVVVALVTVVMDPLALLVVYLLALGFYLSARLPAGLLFAWYTLPMVFVATLAIMFVFTEPGESVLEGDLGPVTVTVTDNGVLLIAKLTLRALAVVTFSLAVFMTTRYKHIVYMAKRTMPGTVATMFLLTYRFLFVTADEMTDVLDSMHARNGAFVRGTVRQTKMYAGIFAHAFVHAFERGERVSKAMEARGFSGELPTVERVPVPGAAGAATMLVAVVVLLLAVMDRYTDLLGV